MTAVIERQPPPTRGAQTATAGQAAVVSPGPPAEDIDRHRPGLEFGWRDDSDKGKPPNPMVDVAATKREPVASTNPLGRNDIRGHQQVPALDLHAPEPEPVAVVRCLGCECYETGRCHAAGLPRPVEAREARRCLMFVPVLEPLGRP